MSNLMKMIFLFAALFLPAFALRAQSPSPNIYDMVQNCGADPTGVIYADTSYQKCYADCVSGGGGIILFDAGKFSLAQQNIIASSKCSIEGLGVAATHLHICISGAGNAFAVSSQNSGIANLEFDNCSGTPTWTSGYAIVESQSHQHYERLSFSGIPQAIYIYNATTNRHDDVTLLNMIGSPLIRCDWGPNFNQPDYGVRFSRTSIGGVYPSTSTGFDQGPGCNTLTLTNSSSMSEGGICVLIEAGSSLTVITDDFECDHSQDGLIIQGATQTLASPNGIQIGMSYFGSTLASNSAAITFESGFGCDAVLTGNRIAYNAGYGIANQSACTINLGDKSIQLGSNTMLNNALGDIESLTNEYSLQRKNDFVTWATPQEDLFQVLDWPTVFY